MNRYDSGFRSLPPFIRAGAIHKADAARGAIFQHRSNGFGPEDDEAVARQFDLSGMAEFWEIELSEPMTCEQFARSLAVHFFIIDNPPNASTEQIKESGPIAIRAVDGVKANVRVALRAARGAGEAWFTDRPEPPTTKLDAKAWLGFVPSDVVIVPPEPPADGIDLSKLLVRPRAAVEWMLAMPKRRHLVPPSLAAFLKANGGCVAQSKSGQSANPRRRGPKPEVQTRVENEMREAVLRGEDLAGMKQAAMEVTFKASADTCRKARNMVLSGTGGVSNSA